MEKYEMLQCYKWSRPSICESCSTMKAGWIGRQIVEQGLIYNNEGVALSFHKEERTKPKGNSLDLLVYIQPVAVALSLCVTIPTWSEIQQLKWTWCGKAQPIGDITTAPLN